MSETMITEQTTIREIISNPLLKGFGHLLFPLNRISSTSLTLEEVMRSDVYLWYSHLNVNQTIDILNYMLEQREQGQRLFYQIYSAKQIKEDPSKKDVGLFYFRGNPDQPCAICNAGGDYQYVALMHDSFPQALELSRNGINAFALIYRPRFAYDDLAKAIAYITDHESQLQIDAYNYSLWGGGNGATMAAALGNRSNLKVYGSYSALPQARAVISQYTDYDLVSEYDAPTFACCGKYDAIASWQQMRHRIERLKGLGIDGKFIAYDDIGHGFGLGKSTEADSWFSAALEFFKEHCFTTEEE